MALGALLLTGFYPLSRAWRANRRTTLWHAVAWATCAWAAWVGAAFLGTGGLLARYLALCLTGCAAVAVLGARRPGVAAWNFVTAALLAPLLLPVAEALGDVRLSVFEASLLSAALLVGLLNYLPTRLAAAVLTAAVACAAQLTAVLKWLDPVWDPAILAVLAVAPWLGLVAARRLLTQPVLSDHFGVAARPGPVTAPRRSTNDEINREWMDFRDRFGAAWALRVRDQFNRASANGGWGVVLDWTGTRPAADGAAPAPDGLAGLRALLRRFRTDEEDAA